MNFSIEIHYDTVTYPIIIEEKEKDAAQNEGNTYFAQSIINKDRKRRRSFPKDCLYNWNDTQNRRYVRFLLKHGHIMNKSIEQKKKFRVNVMMSKFVKTRTSTQCHTHHQKMIKKYQNIDKIIEEYAFLLKKPKTVLQQARVENKRQISEPVPQIIEMESQHEVRQSIWKEYLNPNIFFHEQFEQQSDNLYYF